MELALCSGLTVIWWVLSATVLLPFVILLKYSKSFRNRWFSYIFAVCCNLIFENKLIPLRRKAFELLNEKLSGRDVTKPLKVLEIGIGSGANLKFYPENSHLTALDMNANFGPYFIKNQKKYPQVVYERTINAVAENMKDVEDCSMDLVISTYVLCSVASLNDVLKEVRRVLKPGGKYLFLEHVSYQKSEWGFTLQRFTSPLWNVYFDGCQLTRNIGDAIKNTGFANVICVKIFPQTLIMYVRAHVYGLATK